MDNVTDRTANPFGMRPPCDEPCSAAVEAVFGYGDPNADFHLIGDHPGRHGGRDTGVPFTGTDAGRALFEVLAEVGLVAEPEVTTPVVENLFMSYLHMCCTPGDETPPATAYDRLERFFDAELRAIAAHVLMPVGERAIDHVLHEFTAKAAKVDGSDPRTHAAEVAGRGFLVVPIAEPSTWSPGDAAAITERLEAVVTSDYRQESDLTRFLSTGEVYLVR